MFATEKDTKNFDVQPINYTGDRTSKDFIESLSDSWRTRRFSGIFTSRQNNLHDQFEDYIEEIKKTTGEEIANPYQHGDVEFYMNGLKSASMNPLMIGDVYKGYYDKFTGKNISEFYKQVEKIKTKHPDMPYRSYDDIQSGIKKRAEELRNQINDGRKPNAWGSFIGDTAAIMSDPINVTATLLTAGSGAAVQTSLRAAIARTALYEGAANMAAEAVVQTQVYPYKKELGEDYSTTDVVESIGMAGIGAAVLSSAAIGGKSLLKSSLKKFNELKAKGFKFKPSEEDFASLAEQKIASEEYISQTNPFGDTQADTAFHKAAILEEQSRLLNEQHILSKAYDSIEIEPKGDSSELLLKIEPKDLESVVIERGEFKPFNGTSRSGYGMVKFIFKHGPHGQDAIKLDKSDVLAFPRVIREFEAIPVKSHDTTYRIWSVKREDGHQVMYIDKPFKSGEPRTVVSMHVVQPGTDKGKEWEGVFSPKREPSISKPAVQASVQDTTQGAYYRSTESEGMKDNITPEIQQVNIDAKESPVPRIEEIENLLKENDRLVPLREINGEIEAVSARDSLENIKAEDIWIDEISSCITEFGK